LRTGQPRVRPVSGRQQPEVASNSLPHMRMGAGLTAGKIINVELGKVSKVLALASVSD